MDAPALAQLRARALNAAIRGAILPRGTNSARKSGPKVFASNSGTKTKSKPKLVDVNKSGDPVQNRGLALHTGVDNHKPSLMKKQLFMRARHNQTIRGQAETVEQHMSMTKPVVHRYPEPIKAHDYAEDWTRENHNQSHGRDAGTRARLADLRKALDASD